MKVCGFDLSGALSKNTGQATADKMNTKGEENRERERQRHKQRESVISVKYLLVSGVHGSTECGNSEQVISLFHQWKIHRPE